MRKNFAFTVLKFRAVSVSLVAALAVLAAYSLPAVPAAPGSFECSQPDGSKFKARMHGDEFYRWMESEDGYAVEKDENSGWFEYLNVGKDGRFVKTGLMVGKDSPAKSGIAKGLREARSVVLEKVSAQKAAKAAPPPRIAAKDVSGTVKTLVILANFSDTTPVYTSSALNELFNTPGYNQNGADGCVKDYYDQASYGKVDIQATVSQWVNLPQTKAYYGANSGGFDQNPRQMVSDAIAALDAAGFDFSPFDANGDGWLDYSLDVIHQGRGEEAGGGADCIWSHAWALSSPVTVDGVKIQAYHTEPEQLYSGMTSIGVICHEMGHAICGLPDLYDTDYSSEGVGNWCLMAGGSWNGIGTAGNRPALMSAWAKIYCGWVTPQHLTFNQAAIQVLKGDSNQSIIKINNGMKTPVEYLLIENRQKSGFDNALPAAGLLAWHVDDSQPNNKDETHYKVALLQADGNNDLGTGTGNRGDGGDPYPGSTDNRTLSPSSNPNTDSYYNGPTPITISNISNSGNTMTFDLQVTAGPDMNITGNGTLINSGAAHASTADGTYFGASSASRTFTVKNVGTQELALNGDPRVAISGAGASAFSVSTQPAATLAENATSDFVVMYTYPGGGLQSFATVSIASNDPDANPFTFAIAGGPENFPAGGTMPAGWTEGAGSSAPWKVSSSDAKAGVFSLASGDIGDSQKSVVEVSGEFSEGVVTFWHRVSSEQDYDYLKFYIDGVEKQKWSGDTAWAQASFPISAGTHTLAWAFEKDLYESYGADTAWIDEVVMPSSNPFIKVTSPNGGENWHPGNTYGIAWDSAGVTGNVKIELLKGGSTDSTIAADTVNSGTFSWKIPEGQAAGVDYAVKITSVGDSALTDQSDAFFTLSAVVPVKLTMAVAPAGGGSTTPSTGDHIVNNGDATAIAASPAPAYYFVNWTVSGGAVVADANAATTTATLSADGTVTANFQLKPLKKWLFMVYLDADNNLEPEGISDFLEMATVGSDSNIDIVLQMDRIDGYDTQFGDWKIAHRFHVAKDMTPVESSAIADWGDGKGGGREVNMGDGQTLTDFINWATANYPAENRALVLWNHGGGWRDIRLKLIKELKAALSRNDSSKAAQISAELSQKYDGPMKAICWDESSDDDCLYVKEMRLAIDAATNKLTLIGMDACLMAMAEVAYEIKDTGASVMVGSEKTEPGAGWPYDTILASLAAAPASTPAQFGTIIVNRYYESYGNDETQSAVNLANVGALAASIDSFADTMIASWNTDKAAVKAASDDVIAKASAAVIASKAGSSYRAHGIAINFPTAGADPDYTADNSAFAGDTSWPAFLNEFSAKMAGSWIANARNMAQTFDGEPFTDLKHFCLNISNYNDPVTGYTETVEPNGYIGAGTSQGFQSDEGFFKYTLPFTFKFYGSDYDAVYVLTNGYLDFTSDVSEYENSDAGLVSRVRIAPLWQDLDTTDGDLYIHQPTADSVCFRWKGVTYGTSDAVNFEVVLFQDGKVKFNYGSGNANLAPTIGLSNGNNINFDISSNYNGQANLANAGSLLFTPKNLARLTMAVSPADAGSTLPGDGALVNPGTDVEINAFPSGGYVFSAWTSSGGVAVADANSAKTTATVAADATVTANFVSSFVLTMDVTPAGAGTVTPSIGSHNILDGVAQPISATPSAGYKFQKWTSTGGAAVADESSASTTVTLSADGSVTANFSKEVVLTMAVNLADGGTTTPAPGQHTVDSGVAQNISATPAVGYKLSKWQADPGASVAEPASADTTVTLTQDATVTAVFAKTSASLTMAVEPADGGTVTPAEGPHTVDTGVAVPVEATASALYKFSEWKATAGATFADPKSASTTVTIADDTTVTAVFVKTGAILTMAVSPAGAGTTTPSEGAHPVDIGVPQAVTATAADEYKFSEWQAAGGATFADPKSASTTVTITEDTTVTAVFKKTTAVLTIAADPADGGTTVPAAGQHSVQALVPQNISAAAAAGYYFTGWTIASGTATLFNASSADTTVTLETDASLKAGFSQTPPETVIMTLAVSPAGAGSTEPPAGNYTVIKNVAQNIKAVPAAGYVFVNWTATGGAAVADANAAQTTATLTAAGTVTANFVQVSADVTLTMAANPADGGTVTPAAGTHTVKSGAATDIAATPAAGYYFAGWTASGGAVVENTSADQTKVTLYSDGAVTANFSQTAPTKVQVSIYVSPQLSGTVTPPVGGYEMLAGVPLNVSAKPAPNYMFVNWTSTLGAPVIADANAADTTVTFSADSILVANFKLQSFTLTMATSPAGSGTTTPAQGQHPVGLNEKVAISATPAAGYEFSFWSVEGGAAIAASSASNTSLTMTGNAVVRANFHLLSNIVHLTMAVDPANSGTTTPEIGVTLAEPGKAVAIKAAPAAGYVFSRWEGTAAASVGDANSAETTVTLSADATVTAKFAAAQPVTLTMAAAPDGYGTTAPAPGPHNVQAGIPVQITATAAEGYSFDKWTSTGAVTVENPKQEATSVILSGDATVTANFEVYVLKYDLTVVGGSGSGKYKQGEKPAIAANAPPDGKQFDKWTSSPDGLVADPNSPVTYVNMPAAAVTATATYKDAVFTLTVVDGIVKDNGQASITCPAGTTVTIEASTPAAGKSFFAWSEMGNVELGDDTAASTTAKINGNSKATANFKTDGGGIIVVKSPNGGETVAAGGKMPVSWISDGIVGDVKIQLVKNGLPDQQMQPVTVPNDGLYKWDVPQSKTPGSDYRIKISGTGADAKTASDSSDGNFMIGTAGAELSLVLEVYPEGAGTTDPSGQTSCAAGEPVLITAVPGSGYQFLKWEVLDKGAAEIEQSTSKQTYATLSMSTTVRAYFYLESNFNKTVIKLDSSKPDNDSISIVKAELPFSVTEDDVKAKKFTAMVDNSKVEFGQNGTVKQSGKKRVYTYKTGTPAKKMSLIVDFENWTWSLKASKLALAAGLNDTTVSVDILFEINGKLFGTSIEMDEATSWKYGNGGVSETLSVDGEELPTFSIAGATAKYYSFKDGKDSFSITKAAIGGIEDELADEPATVTIDDNIFMFDSLQLVGDKKYKASDTDGAMKFSISIDLGKGAWTFKLANAQSLTEDIVLSDGVDVLLDVAGYQSGVRLKGYQKTVLTYPTLEMLGK